VRQKDAGLHFSVDDVIAPLMYYELHILEGNGIVKVVTGVVSPIDPTKTPRINTVVISPGYASVSVDRCWRSLMLTFNRQLIMEKDLYPTNIQN